MQTQKEIILTQVGLDKLEEELERLRTVHRKRVAERIRDAMDMGGELADNTEFEEAKNEQAIVEGRIDELKQIIATARVIDDSEVSTDCVDVGSIVKVKDLENEDEWEWTIVGTIEANPAEDRISNESPVGQSLIGKKVGEVATVEIPAGIAKYEIMGIRK